MFQKNVIGRSQRCLSFNVELVQALPDRSDSPLKGRTEGNLCLSRLECVFAPLLMEQEEA